VTPADLWAQYAFAVALTMAGRWVWQNLHLIENGNIGPAAPGEVTLFR
jgi:hypothetical protein